MTPLVKMNQKLRAAKYKLRNPFVKGGDWLGSLRDGMVSREGGTAKFIPQNSNAARGQPPRTALFVCS